MAVRKYSCPDCGLIYDAEVLNFMSGDKDGLLGNYCPNCGEQNLKKGVDA